jgi:hypothetical protein
VVAMWDTDLAATVAKLSPADLVVVSRLPQLMERPASVLAGPGNSVVMLIELLGAAKADAVLAVTIELMAKSSGTELLNLVRTAEVTTGAKVARNRKLREVWRRG